MRLAVDFLPEKFPFISALRVSVLEQPELDISVEITGFIDFLILPFVTDHYMKVIRRFIYQQFGAPNFLEIDLTPFGDDILPSISFRHINNEEDDENMNIAANVTPKKSRISRAFNRVRNQTPLRNNQSKKSEAMKNLLVSDNNVTPPTSNTTTNTNTNTNPLLYTRVGNLAPQGTDTKPRDISVTNSSVIPLPSKELQPETRAMAKSDNAIPTNTGRNRTASHSRSSNLKYEFKRSSSSMDENTIKAILNSSESESGHNSD